MSSIRDKDLEKKIKGSKSFQKNFNQTLNNKNRYIIKSYS